MDIDGYARQGNQRWRLLLVSALLLEVAARAARALDGQEESLALAAPREEAGEARQGAGIIGRGPFDGIRHVARSPYLLGIAALMPLFTIASTFLYFQQAAIVARAFEADPQARTRLFAGADLAVNVLTLVTQVFLTGRLLRWRGDGPALRGVAAPRAVARGAVPDASRWNATARACHGAPRTRSSVIALVTTTSSCTTRCGVKTSSPTRSRSAVRTVGRPAWHAGWAS